MFFGSLLFVAAILKTSNGMPYLPCEYEHLHKCSLGVVAGFGDHPNSHYMSVYCGVVQRLADCLSSSVQCKGELIDSFRFVILHRMTVDKTLELCPHYTLEALKNIVQADEKYRIHVEKVSGVGKDDFAPCAANIHVKCVTRMQQDLEKGVSICSSAQNFMKCFEYPEEPCAAEIYADFVIFLKKYASKVLEMFKESPGILPDC